MARIVIDYASGPFEIEVDHTAAIGVRKANAGGGLIDSWHALVGAKSVTLQLAEGETLEAPPFVDGASATRDTFATWPL